MVIVIHIQHIIFSDKRLNHEKNKRNKKSGARGIRTPDLWHDETKSACVATRASCSVVNKTHTIQNKINFWPQIQILRAMAIVIFFLELKDFQNPNSLVSQLNDMM